MKRSMGGRSGRSPARPTATSTVRRRHLRRRTVLWPEVQVLERQGFHLFFSIDGSTPHWQQLGASYAAQGAHRHRRHPATRRDERPSRPCCTRSASPAGARRDAGRVDEHAGRRYGRAMTTIAPITDADRDDWLPLWHDYLVFYESALPPAVTDDVFARARRRRRRCTARSRATTRAPRSACVHWLLHASTWTTTPTATSRTCSSRRPRAAAGSGGRSSRTSASRRPLPGPRKVYWLTQDDERDGAAALYDGSPTAPASSTTRSGSEGRRRRTRVASGSPTHRGDPDGCHRPARPEAARRQARRRPGRDRGDPAADARVRGQRGARGARRRRPTRRTSRSSSTGRRSSATTPTAPGAPPRRGRRTSASCSPPPPTLTRYETQSTL